MQGEEFYCDPLRHRHSLWVSRGRWQVVFLHATKKRFTTRAKQAHSCLAQVPIRVLPRQLNNGQQTTARAARRVLTQHVSIRHSLLFPRNGKRLIATFHHFTLPVARALSQDLRLNQYQPQAESNCMHKEILISVLAAVGGGWSFLPSFSSRCLFSPLPLTPPSLAGVWSAH